MNIFMYGFEGNLIFKFYFFLKSIYLKVKNISGG